MSIVGNMAGCYSPLGKTVVIVDPEGNELTGVVTEQKQIFTATDNDVREGFVYAGDSGVSTGTKVIPAYHTYQGYRIITAGSALTIPNLDPFIDNYDYTKLQAVVCNFNTDLLDSVSTVRVCIDEKLYPVQSTEPLSEINKNHDTKTIEFGINNESENMQVIRYFMYKEIN